MCCFSIMELGRKFVSFGVWQFAVLGLNTAGFHTWPSYKEMIVLFDLPPHPPLPVYLTFNVCAFGKDQMMRRNSGGAKKINLKICVHSSCRDVCIIRKPYDKYIWMVKTKLYFCIDFCLFILGCTELFLLSLGITVCSHLMTWTLQLHSVTGPLSYLCCKSMNHSV